MKRKLISKLILGTIISTTLFTLSPIKASAEWVNDYQGNWYYMQNNSKITGWSKIDGQLYYFDENGRMQKGWIKAGDSWYFLQNNGALKLGWINYNKNWYYADSTGSIQTGVVNIGGKVYIFDGNGIMKSSNTVINGQFYTIGANGEVVGNVVPTPDKELDSSGNLVQFLKNTDEKVVGSPTSLNLNQVVEDKTESDEDPKEGRTFKFILKDSNGAELKSKTVKYGKSVELDDETKDGYIFNGWNTRSDGSGKSYSSSDKIKVKEDTILYAQWSKDSTVHPDSITIKGNTYVTVNKTIQMSVEASPSNASTDVTWSVTNGTGSATINSSGVLTGISAGTVTVKATSKSSSTVSVTKDVTVSVADVAVPVTQITVTSKTGETAPTINTDHGTLQMAAVISPDYATNKGITWSVVNNTGSASIDANGILTAASNGTVTVKAAANDGSGVIGAVTVTISGQSTRIPVESVAITAKDGTSTNALEIATDGGKLQLIANILPTTASNKGILWSVTSGQDKASISSGGLLTAVADGTVTVEAKTIDGGKVDTKTVTIKNQAVKVAKITITDPLSISGTGKVTMHATVEGKNSAIPTNSGLKWTVQNESGSAVMFDGNTGELLPKSDGTVKVTATALDGSGVSDTKEITISGTGSNIPMTGITVAEENGAINPTITQDDGELTFAATISPTYASTTSSAVVWSVENGSDGGSALIKSVSNSKDKVTIKAVSNGTVTVKATVKDATDPTGKTVKVGSATVRIYKQIQQVEKIEIVPPANGGKVGVNEGLLMTAKVTGGDSQYQIVKWKASNLATDTGSASFDSTINGLLKGIKKGTVTVTAVSTDGYEVASDPITINVGDSQPASSVSIILPKDSSNNDINTIKTNKGTLNLSAAVDSGSTSNVVTWKVESLSGTVNGAGKADIVDNGNSTATITAKENGDVKVTATGTGGVSASQIITITSQDATGITLNADGGVTKIDTLNGTLGMSYDLNPITATTPAAASINWSVSDSTKAAITPSADKKTATLIALDKGSIIVKVTATTANGIQIVGSKAIEITGVKSVGITGGSVTINKDGSDTATLSATVLPLTLTNKSVTWSVSDSSKVDIIPSTDTTTAVVKAKNNGTGTVTVTATSKGAPNVSGTTDITIQ